MDIDFSKYEQDQEEENSSTPKKGKLKKITKFAAYLGIFFIFVIGVFSTNVLMSGQDKDSFLYNIPVVGNLKHMAESSGKKLKGEERERINILLLGMGGEDHNGSKLTDTIILTSIKPKENKASMISIPRDLTLPVAGRGWRKINSINAYAEYNGEDGGLALSQTLSDTLDIPIDYYVKADFQGFVDVINELGGVEVEVEDTLNDYKYPIQGREAAEDYNSRYEHLHIEEGKQEMDGELALKYVRSRHAQGPQGSDFARARRQQKVLQAAKRKFEDTNMLLKPKLISDIMGELGDHVQTNLKPWEMVKLWKRGKDIGPENIKKEVLDNGPAGLLAAQTTEKGAYILTPRSGDFSEIRYLVKKIFSPEKDGGTEKEKKKAEVEGVDISVRNGTWINGLAGRTAMELEKKGFNVVRVGNSSKKDFETSVIYDIAFGEKTEALKALKEEIDANISFDLPKWLKEDINKDVEGEKDPAQPDFILILGRSADETRSGQPNSIQ